MNIMYGKKRKKERNKTGRRGENKRIRTGKEKKEKEKN